MSAIQNLSEDHRHITVAIGAMDRAATLAMRGQVELRAFEVILHFIEVFADGAHYEKEEVLFDALSTRGFPEQMGPIACLNLEHDATRLESRNLRDGLAAVRAGRNAQLEVAAALLRFTTILRVHMPKEDGGFFPMASHFLPKDALRQLDDQFDAIDARLPSSFAAAAQQVVEAVAPSPVPAAAPVRPAAVQKDFGDPRLIGVMQNLARPQPVRAVLPARTGRRSRG